MKLPRDVTGSELSKRLRVLGYQVDRQTGSHIRLTTVLGGEHHLTIPAHDPLKVGTLSGVLKSVGEHHRLTREELLARLFT